jgi:hypothetical protein
MTLIKILIRFKIFRLVRLTIINNITTSKTQYFPFSTYFTFLHILHLTVKNVLLRVNSHPWCALFLNTFVQFRYYILQKNVTKKVQKVPCSDFGTHSRQNKE